MLSRKTGYGILALGCVEANPKERVLTKDIAACTGIPLPFLSQILHALRQAGLVLSKRGSRGGVALARPAQTISLLDVVEALDGPNWFPPCLLGLDDCFDLSACPTDEFWTKERGRIEAELRRLTIADTADCSKQKFVDPTDCCGS